MKVQTQEYFASADALRATAILLVVLNHVFTFARPTIGQRPLEFGYLGVWGVNCFFLLSGCLLAGPFIRVLLDPTKPWPSSREFYIRRFLRIYPLYVVSVVFSIIVMGLLLNAHLTLPAMVTSIFMIQNFSPETIIAVSPPLWTMGVDAAFYVLLPPFAFVLGKFVVTGTYKRRVKALAWTFVGLLAFCLVYRFCAYSVYPRALSDFWISAVYVRNIAGMLAAFTIGAALALFRIVYRTRSALSNAGSLGFIAAGVFVAVAELLLRLGAQSGGHPNVVDVLRATIVDPLAAISCTLIFFGLSQGNVPSLQGIIRSKYVATFAAWAYAVYLFHYPITEFLYVRLLHAQRGTLPFFELAVLATITTLPIAICAHLFVERPFLLLKNKHRDAQPAQMNKVKTEVAMR